jgi:mono/diheme cytochrome c family protein
MRRVSLGLLLSVAVLVFAFIGVAASAEQAGGNPEARKLKNPIASTPESIKAGEATFQKFCRFCHGADAKGNGPQAPKGTHPPDLTDDKWDNGSSDGEIFTSIRDGVGPKFDMKSFKSKLTEQQIWEIVTYLRSVGPQQKAR